MTCPEFPKSAGDGGHTAQEARWRGFLRRPGAIYVFLTLALVLVYAVELAIVLDPSMQSGRDKTGSLFSAVGLGMIPISFLVAVSAALSVFAGAFGSWKWVVPGSFTAALFQLLSSWMVAFEGGLVPGALALLAAALTFAYGEAGESARLAGRRGDGEASGASGPAPGRCLCVGALPLHFDRWLPFACMAIGTLAFGTIVGL